MEKSLSWKDFSYRLLRSKKINSKLVRTDRSWEAKKWSCIFPNTNSLSNYINIFSTDYMYGFSTSHGSFQLNDFFELHFPTRRIPVLSVYAVVYTDKPSLANHFDFRTTVDI